MTRSVFDPTGPDAEHGGTRNLGPDAGNISHMPPDVTDGEVKEQPAPCVPDESAETEQIAEAEKEADTRSADHPGRRR